MRNCKGELLTALIAALKTAMPTMTVRTKLNDFDTSSNAAYPYIYISDTYQNENGPKNYHAYDVELLIQVVYKDLTDLATLYTSQNSVLGLFNIPKSLTLTNNFEITETVLINSTDSEIKIDTGILNIGLIRMRFSIVDKNDIAAPID